MCKPHQPVSITDTDVCTLLTRSEQMFLTLKQNDLHTSTMCCIVRKFYELSKRPANVEMLLTLLPNVCNDIDLVTRFKIIMYFELRRLEHTIYENGATINEIVTRLRQLILDCESRTANIGSCDRDVIVFLKKTPMFGPYYHSLLAPLNVIESYNALRTKMLELGNIIATNEDLKSLIYQKFTLITRQYIRLSSSEPDDGQFNEVQQNINKMYNELIGIETKYAEPEFTMLTHSPSDRAMKSSHSRSSSGSPPISATDKDLEIRRKHAIQRRADINTNPTKQ
jgi:hypothetical protein